VFEEEAVEFVATEAVGGFGQRMADDTRAEVESHRTQAPRKNNCMIPGVTQSMSCTISLLSRGFHILPTAHKQSCSILV
jgi:hypothetical protein